MSTSASPPTRMVAEPWNRCPCLLPPQQHSQLRLECRLHRSGTKGDLEVIARRMRCTRLQGPSCALCKQQAAPFAGALS